MLAFKEEYKGKNSTVKSLSMIKDVKTVNVTIVVREKNKRKPLATIVFKHPIHVYYVISGNTEIYEVTEIDHEYSEELIWYGVNIDKFYEKLRETVDLEDEKEHVYTCKIGNIRETLDDLELCMRHVVEKYVRRKLIGLKHYKWKDIGGGWAYDIYRLSKNPLVTAIVSENTTFYVTTEIQGSKDIVEHERTLRYLVKEHEKADISFGLFVGIITECNKCGEKVKVTWKNTKCPRCGNDLYKQLREKL